MLTSAVAFSDRFTQHSSRIMPEITESDLFTEQVLKSSGHDYTVLYHHPFTDVLSIYYDANPFQNGINVPAGNGKMASATRDELAEAHAEIFSTAGHEKKTYTLGGSKAVSFADTAKILADVTGKPVPFLPSKLSNTLTH